VRHAKYIVWVVMAAVVFLSTISGCVNPWISNKRTMACCAHGMCSLKSVADGCCQAQNPTEGQSIVAGVQSAHNVPEIVLLPVRLPVPFTFVLPEQRTERVDSVDRPPPNVPARPLPILI
jgi:hypothetical protein